MRWTDLPPGRGPADADASVVPRGEWDDLRRQLERLPPGHPSRPGDEDLADGDGAGDNLAGEHRAGRGTAGEPDSPARRGVRDNKEGHRGVPGGHGELSGPSGRREPYRPWFTEGEPPPWFAADPEDGP
jgi:hypothetical protein